MTHFGTMNHHISHRENGIGFLHLRTLSIQVQVSFEHEKFFSPLSFEQTRNSEDSIFGKNVKTLFSIFGPSFRSIHHFMPKIAIFSEGIFKMSWMKTFNRQRRKNQMIEPQRIWWRFIKRRGIVTVKKPNLDLTVGQENGQGKWH